MHNILFAFALQRKTLTQCNAKYLSKKDRLLPRPWEVTKRGNLPHQSAIHSQFADEQLKCDGCSYSDGVVSVGWRSDPFHQNVAGPLLCTLHLAQHPHNVITIRVVTFNGKQSHATHSLETIGSSCGLLTCLGSLGRRTCSITNERSPGCSVMGCCHGITQGYLCVFHDLVSPAE